LVAISKKYEGQADFMAIYIKEAHPTDEWQMDSNEKEGICYPQPKTLNDRVAIANDFVTKCEFPIPIFVDDIDNKADDAYAGWPERLYIIHPDGTIAYKGKTGPFGFEPDEVDTWLSNHVKGAERGGK
jgi:hypothetical protein